MQTGNEAVPLGAGRADCHTATSLGDILSQKVYCRPFLERIGLEI